MTKYRNELEPVIGVTKALADPTRVRLLMALRGGACCVCQLVELVALAPSTVSKHLSILRQAGLASQEKRGRWIYYALPESPVPVAAGALAYLEASLAGDLRIADDTKRMRAIKKLDPELLCCRQS